MTDLNKNTKGLEDALKRALVPQDAPDGFADRVLARVAVKNSSQPATSNSWLRLFSQPTMRWTALAAFATAMILGVHIFNAHLENVHRENAHREQVQGEAAKQRLMLALRVAGSKLHLAKAKVNDLNQNQSRQVKE
jgi:hypothetical protein